MLDPDPVLVEGLPKMLEVFPKGFVVVLVVVPPNIPPPKPVVGCWLLLLMMLCELLLWRSMAKHVVAKFGTSSTVMMNSFSYEFVKCST